MASSVWSSRRSCSGEVPRPGPRARRRPPSAREAGTITNDQYSTATEKALAKTAVVQAASTVTGGLAGEFASGAAAPIGRVIPGFAEMLGATTGGVAAGLGGHLAGDLFAQGFQGKDGFDSVGDYAQSAKLGGLMGAVTGG